MTNCGKNYINFCVPNIFIVWRWKQVGLCTIAILIPIVQHKMIFFFFLLFRAPIFEHKVITKKSAECCLSQAQNIIKIWKFTIKKKKIWNSILRTERPETRVSNATVPMIFFIYSNSGVDLLIFSPFFGFFFFLMISLSLFMSWLVEFIWFVHDYCSILIICNTAYQ